MTFFSFNDAIPATNNNPSVDQPDMLTNNISTQGILGIDHYSFNDNDGGWHKQVTLPSLLAIPAIPPRQATLGTIYTKTVQVAVGPVTAPTVFYSPGNAGIEYQITRTNDGVSGFFGQFVNNYNGVGVDFTGGWTFLPGGLYFQYGLFQPTGGFVAKTGTINFPVQFINPPFIVQPVLISKVGGTSQTHVVSVIDTSVSSTSFQWNTDAIITGSYVGIYWTAIGI